MITTCNSRDALRRAAQHAGFELVPSDYPQSDRFDTYMSRRCAITVRTQWFSDGRQAAWPVVRDADGTRTLRLRGLPLRTWMAQQTGVL